MGNGKEDLATRALMSGDEARAHHGPTPRRPAF